MVRRAWVHAGRRAGTTPPPGEKSAITAACDAFIADVLKPRFLAEIRPSTEYNYPIALYGKWLGNKYRFITRYRSEGPYAYRPEFDASFARIEYKSRDCFDLSYHRHTGEWLCLFERITLTEALKMIESTPHFTPC